MTNHKLAYAIAFAAEQFKTVVDKQGKPYIMHCLEVMYGVSEYPEYVQAAAVLHDIVENTNVTLQRLHTMKFSPETIHLVDLLTKQTNQTYEEYIERISSNRYAVAIKLSDLRHNTSVERTLSVDTDKDVERILKYHRTYLRLKEVA